MSPSKPQTGERPEVPDRPTLLEMFRVMALVKECDERMRAMIKAGWITAPYYSPRGQEAVSAGMAASLRTTDYLVTTYRGLHDHLAKGVPLKELWAEYAGKVSGSCKGKGGPMHITYPAAGVMVTSGIVGSGILIANGLALASQVRNDGRATVASFGDGASNIGAFHEALNLASLWRLPVIFLCQNNGYAEHTKFENCTAGAVVAERAAAYGMPGVRVDGNDPVAVWRVLRQAVALARGGEGPTLVEAKTFRFQGHNFGDPGDYIPREEYQTAVAKDPYPRYRSWLVEGGHAGQEELQAMESRAQSEVEQAIEHAKAAPEPDAEELRRDVYRVEIDA